VVVSKYYLDRRPLSHTLPSQLPTQQYFEPPPDSESIEIGDNIRVWNGPQAGKFGIVTWITTGSDHLLFRDICTEDDTEINGGLSSISVPTAFVQRTNLKQTLQYMKERGYDVRPGDTVSVVRGPEYQAKGFVHSVDYPNARLTLVCDGDRSLVSSLHLHSSISDL
jgi:ribosomal protein L24